MKGKYCNINLFTSFVIEIACVYGMLNERQLYGQGNTIFKRKAIPDYRILLDLDYQNPHIFSPGFPNNYLPDTQIIYEIEMQLDDEVKQMSSRMLLTFEMFMLEESDSCTKDGLEIADSTGTVRVYCGSQGGRVILSESSKLQIRFFSNPTVESVGFDILFELYNTECSQLFKGVSNGTFATPNFPKKYYAYDICVWKIEVTKGKIIHFRFNEIFDIWAQEPLCNEDYLAVSFTGNFNTNYSRYCNSERPKSIFSSGNSMLFMFRSDCCYEGKGFSASFVVTDSGGVPPTPPSDPSTKKRLCGCGKENKLEGERIKGGKTVHPPNRYPFVVVLLHNLYKNNTFFCGGTLISRLYVLTAAHCLVGKDALYVSIALGPHKIVSGSDQVPVESFNIHPDYSSISKLHDIALIRLRSPVHLTKKVGLACLPIYSNFTSPTYIATVAGGGVLNGSGFGRLNSSRRYFPKELQELQVSIVSNEICFSKLGRPDEDTNICAGGKYGIGPCFGDSGGGLFVKYDERWFVVGVFNWFRGLCVYEDYPAVYARVSKYLNWISFHTQDSPHCDINEIIPPQEPNLENCGIPNERDEGRIAGGTEADPFEFPWIARIVYNQSYLGVGSLISPKYVLTVTSIFDTLYYKMLSKLWMVDVFLGRHRISLAEPKFRKFDVEAVSRPELFYKPTPYNNDLALLKLKVPAAGMPYTYRPICLPRSDATYSQGVELKIAGWGRISKSGYVSDVLRKADMYTWSKESCVRRYPKWFTENMICAYKDETDTCEGDNGAPLMMLHNGRYYLAGLAFGSNDGCATPGDPRLFSAVHSNLLWIYNVTGLSVS